jgi:flagellar biosynthesis/type III secretory pathway protein FliH
MNLPRARILRGGGVGDLQEVRGTAGMDRGRARVVRRETLEGVAQAERLVRSARQSAKEIVERAAAEAEQQFAGARQRAEEAQREDAAAAVAAQRVRDAKADLAASDRILEIARLLAERLLQDQLRAAPEMLVPIAREAIAQFWRAEAITVRACAADVNVLRAHVEELGAAASALRFEVDETCTAGSIKVATGQGALDANIGMQLDRLVEALRR